MIISYSLGIVKLSEAVKSAKFESRGVRSKLKHFRCFRGTDDWQR